EKTKPSYFVRDKRFKLYGDGRFYDLQSDVLEKTDIPTPDGPALTAYKKLQAALASMPNEGSKLLKFPE
ncbi:MAG TPA: arylsulfatase A, partial [Planctomycetaceae bacterium]|nr:arylsulfatase A [Planctomycetaceae bacterium]